MIFEGFNNQVILPNVNQELAQLEGFLSEEKAREALVKYFRYNPGIAVEWLTGKELLPLQRLMIRAMFSKDFFLTICSRGMSKSWTAAVFCFLYALFEPNSRIGILSKTFRQSQIVFRYIEDFANSPEGILLRQCFVKEPSHKNEIWRMELGSSTIVCLPLGEAGKLRGFRFSVVVIDELLLLPKDVIQEVILPFLRSSVDPIKHAKIEKQENDLIKRGLMKESERTIFPAPKFIGLSSASYHFEFLYELYKSYLDKIYDPNNELSRSYGIMQFAYEVVEQTKIYNPNFISEMKSSMSQQAFNREFGSLFTDDSGGYFSKKKLEECTIKPGNEPTIEIEGEENAKYLLTIDPSWSKSEAGDHFAMSVFKLNELDKTATLVHNYAVAGGQAQDHMLYLRYILQYFNIVFVVYDKAGGSVFIEDANLSTIFAEAGLKLELMDVDFMDEDYARALHQAKMSYNLTTKRIVYGQYFSPQWIRRANEMLAASFDHKKIFFGSPAIDTKFNRMLKSKIPIQELNYDPTREIEEDSKLGDFIEYQTDLIDLTKNETILIQLTSDSDSATHKFRLPANIRKSDSPTKARRDNYTTLLLGNWGMQQYYNMMFAPTVRQESFIPRFIA